MNWAKHLIISLVVVALLVLDGHGTPHPQAKKLPRKQARVTWEYVGKTNSEYWFRNIRTIHRTPKGTILTWFRITVPAPDMEYAFRSNNKVVWSPLFEEMGHSLQLWEFNCSTTEMRALQDISYDGEGKVISQHSHRNSTWSYAIPDSIGESTLAAMCKP
jgi:hypothetical protein